MGKEIAKTAERRWHILLKYLAAEEILVESAVTDPYAVGGSIARISLAKLSVAQLKIKIKDLARFGGHLERFYRAAASDRFGDLDGQDALPFCRVSEKNA